MDFPFQTIHLGVPPWLWKPWNSGCPHSRLWRCCATRDLETIQGLDLGNVGPPNVTSWFITPSNCGYYKPTELSRGPHIVWGHNSPWNLEELNKLMSWQGYKFNGTLVGLNPLTFAMDRCRRDRCPSIGWSNMIERFLKVHADPCGNETILWS